MSTAPFPPLGFFRRQLELTPKQFGYMGSYSREMLSVEEGPQAFGQMAVRFTTSVLSGKTVTEKQRATVKVPASWWQHLKQAAGERHKAWMRKPSSPWLLFLLPLDILTLVPRVYLVPWFLRRYPVKYAELTAEVRFTQDVLYPGADVDLPADCFGMPILWETAEIEPLAPYGEPWALEGSGPARFLDRRDVAREFFRDADTGRSVAYADPGTVHGLLEWLGRRGVNVDQLIARSGL